MSLEILFLQDNTSHLLGNLQRYISGLHRS